MILLESAMLAVKVLWEVGGKVGQIHYKPARRDVLVSPQKPYRTIPADASWLDYDTSGMDDCFPNVAAGRYPLPPHDSMILPDLGEWTHGIWEAVGSGPRGVHMRRDGDRLPYTAWKEIRFAAEDTLEFLYRVENRGRLPLRYMWSAHPLLQVAESYRLVMPGENITSRTFPPDGQVHTWPLRDGSDLSCNWIERGKNLKIFLSGLREGWCALLLPEYTVRFTFSLESTPIVGLWFNNDGFPEGSNAPFRCIAVEPCTSPSDLLDDCNAAAYPVLPARGGASWWLRMQIAPPAQGQFHPEPVKDTSAEKTPIPGCMGRFDRNGK